MENGRYFLTIEKDDADLQAVQEEAFLCLTEDMGEIGIYWACDNADICGSSYDLDQALSVLGYVMPNMLYPKMRTDEKLTAAIQSMLDGDISNNSLIEDYLEFLGGTEEQLAYVPELTDAVQFVSPNIRNTAIFSDYLSALMSKLREEKKVSVVQLTSPHDYQRIVQMLMSKCQDAQVYLDEQKIISEETVAKLIKRRYITLQYLTQADKYEIFSWVLLTNPLSLPDSSREIYRKYLKELVAGCRMTAEYYLTRHIEFDEANIVSVLCFLYARSSNVTMFNRKVSNFAKQVSDNANLIMSFGDLLAQYLEKMTTLDNKE